MGIGTSKGAYYDDAFHHAAAQWDDKYESEENMSVLQSSLGERMKDLPDDPDPDMVRLPLEVSPSPDIDRNAEKTPDSMQIQKMTGTDPRNIYSDNGDIVGYDSPTLPVIKQIPHFEGVDLFSKTPNQRVSDAFGQLIQSQSDFNEIDAQAK